MYTYNKVEFQKGRKYNEYGIFDKHLNQFREDVAEDTPMLAKARLMFIIGKKQASKRRYIIQTLPEDSNIKSLKSNGDKYGIWNDMKHEYQFNISEDSPELAIARLFHKIGEHARRCRFVSRKLSKKE